MRSKEYRCLEFVVGWKDGDCTTEPIHNLIDFDTQEVTEQLIPILRQYMEVVKRYPSTQRKCWLCDRKCNKGGNVCYVCAGHAPWLVPYLGAWIPVKKLPREPARAWTAQEAMAWYNNPRSRH